jgi:gliding motility-associated-like protein
MQVLLRDSSTQASNVRRWLINGVGIPNQSPNLNYIFQNTLLRDSVYTIQLAVRNDLGFNCRDTATQTIRIFSKPRSNDLIVTPTEGCSPLDVQFFGNVENAVNYLWDFGDGGSLSDTGQNQNHTFVNFSPVGNQVYTIRRIAQSVKGCTDTTLTSVIVKPRTQAIISTGLVTSGCSPLQISFSAANSVNYSTVEWNFGDNSPINTSETPAHVFTNASDTQQVYRVRLIARKNQLNSCPDTAFVLITVNPSPAPAFSMSSSIGCGPLADTLVDLSTGGSQSYWTFNSGGISTTLIPDSSGYADTLIQNPNFVTKTVQVIQTVITAQGCSATTSQTIQVFPNLTSTFAVDTSGCHPHLAKFINNSENFQGSYSWNFGNGNFSAEKNPLHLYENFTNRDTTFQVTLTSISPVGNCTKTSNQTVRVYATPRADFAFLSDSSIQLPVSSINIGNRTRFRESWKYQWTFDDGTGISTDSSASFTHVFPLGNAYFTDTNFVISMVATSPRGCSDTLRKTMAILPGRPVAAFDVTPRIICAGKQVQFTNQSSFASEWEWTYQDAPGSPNITIKNGNPNVFFGSPGRKTVKLKVKGLGGSDSLTKFDHIFVYAKPSSYFEVLPLNKEVVAPEDEATFFEIPPCDDTSGCKFFWNFGDGTTDTLFDNQPVRHRYLSAGKYNISLLVTNSLGCSSGLTRDSIRAVQARDISVPNAFIPLNVPGGCPIDNFKRLPTCIFYPLSSGMVGIQMQIFNRWGQQIFASYELGEGWDGFYQNQPVPPGTYVYKIVAEFSNGDVQTLTGDVTVIR